MLYQRYVVVVVQQYSRVIYHNNAGIIYCVKHIWSGGGHNFIALH